MDTVQYHSLKLFLCNGSFDHCPHSSFIGSLLYLCLFPLNFWMKVIVGLLQGTEEERERRRTGELKGENTQKQNAKFQVQRSSCGMHWIRCTISDKVSSYLDNFYSSSTESGIEKCILNFPFLAVKWYYFKM